MRRLARRCAQLEVDLTRFALRQGGRGCRTGPVGGRRFDVVLAGIHGDGRADRGSGDALAIELERHLLQERRDLNRQERDPWLERGQLRSHQAKDVRRALETRLSLCRFVLGVCLSEATEVLLAKRDVIANAGRQTDLRHGVQLLQRVGPTLRVFVLLGLNEEVAGSFDRVFRTPGTRCRGDQRGHERSKSGARSGREGHGRFRAWGLESYQLAGRFAIAFPALPMGTELVTDVAAARDACNAARSRSEPVAFVPTMGALHAGHLALVDEAKRRGRFVVVSIFVNPTQFGPAEDFARYPRDLDGDVRKLTAQGVSLVFAPQASALYEEGDQTRVRLGPIAQPLDGVFRPGHFDGVATVVAKLFAIVGPCTSLFGRKDYQQLLVVQRMARDLFLPVQVVGCATVREPDGLAMSSRNAYLSPSDRSSALQIVRGLDAAARRFASGERSARELERIVRVAVEAAASSIDYVEARDADTLAPIDDAIDGRAVLAVACRVAATRLIDNVVLGEDPPPLASLG